MGERRGSTGDRATRRRRRALRGSPWGCLLILGGAFAGPAAGGASAQIIVLDEFRVPAGGGPASAGSSGAPRLGFEFCRLMYVQVRGEALGQGWRTDYPDADHNLSLRLSQLVPTEIPRTPGGRPDYRVVRAGDPEFFECPFLFASDVGTAGFSVEEMEALRTYFAKGGFLWVDDFWGDRAWSHWEALLGAIAPELEIVDLPLEHPLFEIVYRVDRVPQVPSIQFWRSSGGQTSERGAESATPHLRAALDARGTIRVLMSHNTDIADGWEREAEDDAYFALYSPDAYAIGINIAVWAMTH